MLLTNLVIHLIITAPVLRSRVQSTIMLFQISKMQFKILYIPFLESKWTILGSLRVARKLRIDASYFIGVAIFWSVTKATTAISWKRVYITRICNKKFRFFCTVMFYGLCDQVIYKSRVNQRTRSTTAIRGVALIRPNRNNKIFFHTDYQSHFKNCFENVMTSNVMIQPEHFCYCPFFPNILTQGKVMLCQVNAKRN